MAGQGWPEVIVIIIIIIIIISMVFFRWSKICQWYLSLIYNAKLEAMGRMVRTRVAKLRVTKMYLREKVCHYQ